ncbi:MAG: hypothetical protein EB127_04940 [Alphaproteobacteria bacterium]|nr:hypothetical protein [Alphaproteobacteria bacterium]
MRKSEEDFNVKKHAEYDVSKLNDYISKFSDEWLLDTSRQERPNTPHKYTNTYNVYNTSIQWKKGQEFVVKKVSTDTTLLELLEPILQDLEKIHNGVRGNVLLIKLKAKEDVALHEDAGDYLMLSRRNHVPIITSGNVVFGVGSERINMQIGECWEINNYRFHWVDNDSDIDRVHLLVDIMPNEELLKS